MKKRLLSLQLALLLVLSGCFHSSSGDVIEAIPGFHIYATSEFQLQIPNEWDVLTKVDLRSDIPAATIGAFRSNIKSPVFTPTVVVTRNELENEMTTLDYAKLLHAKVAQDLVDYKEIAVDEEDILIAGTPQKGLFVYVEGREDATRDAKRFIQRIGIKGNQGYIITGAVLTNSEEGTQEMVENIVRSFQVK